MTKWDQKIDWLINRLKQDQSSDGSWAYPFDTGTTTDAYMIILLRTLAVQEDQLIRGLAQRILSKQSDNGAWKLFADEENGGNLSATVEAYYALLASGFVKKDDPRLVSAKKFILEHGGIQNTSMFTKIMLAITGKYKWPAFSPFPVEMILLPAACPINLYQFSIFGRANLIPIMILASRKFSMKMKNSPDLSDLFSARHPGHSWPENRDLLDWIGEELKKISEFPERLHASALDRAKKYMLARIEPDGTFYSYFSATFLMIFALLSLGHFKNGPIIQNAVKGLLSMATVIDGLPHMQYTTANVWNTALISYAMQNAGVPKEDKTVAAANRYLLSRQHNRSGDWKIHNPHGAPGGWGFSDINTINPDVDDTTAALRALIREAAGGTQTREAWKRGVNWTVSMQNRDGGWAAFEKNVHGKWLKLIPVEKAEYLLGDPSSADLTGRTLEFLGNYTNLENRHPAMEEGADWLIRHQRKDGSWYGRWGICYLYGTWAASTGLAASGIPASRPALKRAAGWIQSVQNHDGGWGESCRSDIHQMYIPLGHSTLTHTAWALDTLIAVSEKPTVEMEHGITWLLSNLEKQDWTTAYPVGQGMAGTFYIHYHSYRYIFPLLALGNYRRKYS
ncbi:MULTISPECIES: squalene--hopene cyclase [Heyndrickxia]|uniref:squalene--hopene cyclase n=1 Tax=Heyndrickxia TaxID=2837504 RepID=UPI0008F8804D|nr:MULTISPECIES: squalene--hopene cyclase [Heyndrickxia]APB38560.1 squalene--hopene cyclase [Heyndrickxia coagulans]MBQ4911244.1 squalene--hopene cyclase [Heyndrickxia faecalis]MED4868782.1 squalene--hopene cyclase [Weizmannia sp. CD-2023]QPG53106.1 squalene--hopene cyclase [Heyndrickxia coagulans]UXC21989.1 squalene--hopene cyclase [Heyndrickxia coagulans]